MTEAVHPIELDLQHNVGSELNGVLQQLTAAANSFFLALASDLGWRVPPTRLLLTGAFDEAVRQVRPQHDDGTEVIRERLGGRVVGKAFFKPRETSVCIIEIGDDTSELSLPLIAATIAHEITHVVLLHSCEDHGARDLGRFAAPGRSLDAAMTAYDAVEEYRCDAIASVFLSQHLSVTTEGGNEPVTTDTVLGDAYGETALAQLDSTAATIVPAVWEYRITDRGLDDLWNLVRRHVWEVLTLYAHARATVPNSPSLTSEGFTGHQFGKVVTDCWDSIGEAMAAFELLPPADTWADAQRALVTQGGAAVERVYATLGITPTNRADGSLHIAVDAPTLRLNEGA